MTDIIGQILDATRLQSAGIEQVDQAIVRLQADQLAGVINTFQLEEQGRGRARVPA